MQVDMTKAEDCLDRIVQLMLALHAEIEAARYPNEEHCFELTAMGGGVSYFMHWPNISILSTELGKLLEEIQPLDNT